MLELPFLQEILTEGRQKDIVMALISRFGSVPNVLKEELRPIEKDAKLDELMPWV